MPSATSSNYYHDKSLDFLLKNISWTPPASLWIALYTTVPALDGTGGVEVSTSGTNYSRLQISASGGWNGPGAGANREYVNSADHTFNVPTANWGTIAGAVLHDAQTGGNMFFVAYLSTPKTVNNGDGAPKILAGQMRISRASC